MIHRQRAIEKASLYWNLDKHKKELPDVEGALISICSVSPEVVRDDECEALGGPQERRTAGSRQHAAGSSSHFYSMVFSWIAR